MQIVTSADALARATYNALLYAMKDGRWAMTLLTVARDRVTFITSNSYALSYSHCSAETPEGLTEGIAFKLSYADLKALEARCREGKKERCSLEFILDDHEIWYRGEDSEKDLRMEDIFEDGIDADSWDEINLSMFWELLAERADDPQARKVLLNPEYLRKLAQAKKEKDQGAHLWLGKKEDDTVLAKIGEDLWVLIEPIDPERHRAALGEGATW